MAIPEDMTDRSGDRPLRRGFGEPYVLLSIFLFLTLPLFVHAQLTRMTLTSISPSAGQIGTDIQLDIAGPATERATGLQFSHPGITATAVAQKNEILGASFPVDRKFNVHIDKSVPYGLHEVVATGPLGVSNPRLIWISPDPILPLAGDAVSRERAMALKPNQAVSGHFANERFHWFRFSARKDQTLTVECLAEQIDSRANATLVLRDAQGMQLKRSLDAVGRDPQIFFRAPTDGEYFIELYDYTYKGGADYPFVLRLHDRPVIRDIFPSFGKAGGKGKFQLQGWNLPGKQRDVEIQLPVEPQSPGPTHRLPLLPQPGIYWHLENRSNPVFIRLSQLEPSLETSDAENQKISIPAELAGRFDTSEDRDVFEFEGKKGQAVSVRLFAHRLGQPIDPVVKIEKIKDGKPIKFKEDDDSRRLDDKRYAVFSRDPEISLTLDEDATYRVTIRDQFASRGPPPQYRLSLTAPEPGFDLALLPKPAIQDEKLGIPCGLICRPNGSVALRVVAIRRGGFDGEIALQVEGAQADPARIDAGTSDATLILRQPTSFLKVFGEAAIGETRIRRQAIPFTLQTQVADINKTAPTARVSGLLVFAPQQITPETLKLARRENKKIETCVASRVEIPFTLQKAGKYKGDFQIRTKGIPGLKTNPNVKIKADQTEGKFTLDLTPADIKKFRPGTYQVRFEIEATQQGVRLHEESAGQAEEKKKQFEERIKQLDADSKKTETAFNEAKAKAEVAKRKSAEQQKKNAAAVQTALREQEEANKLRDDVPDKAERLKQAETKLKQAREQEAKDKKTAIDEVTRAEEARSAAESALKAAREKTNQAKKARDEFDKWAQKQIDLAKPKDMKFIVRGRPFEISIAADPVEISIAPPPAFQPEKEQEITVKVNRLFGFDGEVNLELRPPNGVKDLPTGKATLAKGQTEVKLKWKPGKSAPIGKHELTLRANAKLNNQALVDEQKLPVEITAPTPPS